MKIGKIRKKLQPLIFQSDKVQQSFIVYVDLLLKIIFSCSSQLFRDAYLTVVSHLMFFLWASILSDPSGKFQHGQMVIDQSGLKNEDDPDGVLMSLNYADLEVFTKM